MKTLHTTLLALALCVPPAIAEANGLSLELGLVWAAPQETAFRAVDDRGDTLTTIGLGGAWTVTRLGDFRVDALASWGAGTYEAALGSEIDTSLLEHGFELGGRLRWSRFFFAQPYVSLRAGPVFGWFDVEGQDSLESFDVAARIEPAAGIEGFFPWSGLSTRLPHPWSRVRTKSGWAGAGVGLGLEAGYRFQSAYQFDAEPPEPEDEDEAKDAIPRQGPNLGRLTLSGVRMGIHVTLRF